MRPVRDLAELESLPVGSIVAYFWSDGSGPTVEWHDADDAWTNGDVCNMRMTAADLEQYGDPLMLVHDPRDPRHERGCGVS